MKKFFAHLKLLIPRESIFAPEKVNTVAQMQKMLKKSDLNKEVMDDIVETKRGRALAPLSDKRPAISSVDTMFKEV